MFIAFVKTTNPYPRISETAGNIIVGDEYILINLVFSHVQISYLILKNIQVIRVFYKWFETQKFTINTSVPTIYCNNILCNFSKIYSLTRKQNPL